MPDGLEIHESDALLITDVQNDFCPGGGLAVPDGHEVVPIINRLATSFRTVILTQDWHPLGHLSFASSHSSKMPFDTITLEHGEQILWPDHCVQDTPGAELYPGLKVPHAQLILRKGYHRDIDSYSAFLENDQITPTGLAGYLRERGLTRVLLAGLALDFCVRYSAEDACRCGFKAIVIEDACRAIDTDDGSLGAARQSFAELAIMSIKSTELNLIA